MKSTLCASLLVGLALTACGDATPSPAAPAPPTAAPTPAPAPPAVAAAPALHGALTEDIDRTADPCTDFFQFANGAWRAKNPIPASMPKWSRRWESGETNKEHLKQLLEELAAVHDAPQASSTQIVGDFYGACMDDKRADAAGVTPLAPYFAEIDAIKTRADIEREIRHLHAIGIDVGFQAGANQDLHDPTHVQAWVTSGGLGLPGREHPDRDYYVKKEPRFEEARAKYRAHMATMFGLAGRKVSPAALEAVFAFETTLAKATLDNVAQRDPKNQDHPTTFAALGKSTPHFNWKAYDDALGIPLENLNVTEPAFLAAFDKALATAPIEVWKNYLAWHLLHEAAPFLSRPLVDEDFAFYQAYLEGKKEQKPRWKICAENADALFGEALGKEYVARYFSPEAKARMTTMVDNILLATGDRIRAATWMSDATKQRALTKLGTFNKKIGYPDKWKDYSQVHVKRDTLWEDIVAGSAFAVVDDHGQMGKPVDRARWGMTPPTSNAYYNPQLNEIVFPAGILQPPMFDMKATDAVNYGAIGVVIGHEVSHGFDDQGAQYDEKGALSNWWTPEDYARFQERGKCVSDQFDGYFIEPGIHHNGKLVLGESIGDLGGVTIAWVAFQKSLAGGTAPTIDGFTPAQQFFLAYGQSRGDETRPETQRLMMQSDPHPVAKFRVLGPLSNRPEFAQAFSCKAGAPMVRPDDKRCVVW